MDMNSYFASVEQQDIPALRSRPIAVLPLMADSTSVIAASHEAKKFGIKVGTPVWKARRMCPELQLVMARPDMYVKYHYRILAEVEKHIPVSEVGSIDEMACALDISEQTPEKAQAQALRIKEGLKNNIGPYIKASIGLAPSQFLAKVATDIQKPDGLVTLMPGCLPDALLHLELTDLPGISTSMANRLARGGIWSIKDLWNIQPKHARSLWGSVMGERFWYALHGYDFATPPSRKSSVSHSQVLAPDVRNWRGAYPIGRRLVQKAASRLRRMGYSASCFWFYTRTVDRMRWNNSLSLPTTDDTFTFLHVFEALWQAAEKDLGGKSLLKIGIALTGLVPNTAVQPDLFYQSRDNSLGDQSYRKLFEAMDKLNAKYGRDTVMLGLSPLQQAKFTGTKIAFNRIPQEAEFRE